MKKNRIFITGVISVFFVATISAIVVANRHGSKNEADSTEKVAIETTVPHSTSHTHTTESVEPTSPEEEPTLPVDTSATEETAEPETTETTAGNTTDKTTTPTTTEEITTTEAVTVENTAASEEIKSTEFSFMKYNIDGMAGDFNWKNYLVQNGYAEINTQADFVTYATNFINNLQAEKDQKYLITPAGLLDDLSNTMQQANDAATNNPIPDNIYYRDELLYKELGLDYQTYYSKGISIFKIRKIQDVVNNVTNSSVYAIYYYSYETPDEMAAVTAKVTEIVAGFSGTDYEKAKAAYDYICGCTVYDESSVVPLISHTAYGSLVNGVAVCEGYAKAYKLLLDAMNIPCDIILNSTHAWNEAYIDNAWYFIDITNCDCNNASCYFMLGKDVLYSTVNITIDGYILNETDGKQISYYNYKDSVNTSVNDLSATTYNAESRLS